MTTRRVLFVQHDHVSPLGPVGERFAERGFAIDVMPVVPADRFDSPDVSAEFPEPAGYDVLVPLGAPWGAWDDDRIGTWLLPELDWLREADRAGVPVFGICFGGQLLARALGGSVAPGPRWEIGWTPVHTDDEQLVSSGPWFQFHRDRWTLPPGSVEVARNPVASQAFVLRRNLAVQFHPELDTAGLRGWLDGGGTPTVIEDGLDPAAMLAQTDAEGPGSRLRAHALVDAFLNRVALL